MVNTVVLENGNGSAVRASTTAGHEHHFGTRLIHAGSEATEDTGAVIPAINLSTTYKQTAVGVHKVSK
jgi:cystathionine gamma-lyase